MPTWEQDTPTVRQLKGGRVWKRKAGGVSGWSYAEDYDILQSKDGRYCVLVSFIHDPLPGDDCEFWRKRFNSVTEAMEYAERI